MQKEGGIGMTTDWRLCPECSSPMMKNGHRRIGRFWYQMWLCARKSGCGRTQSVKIVEVEK